MNVTQIVQVVLWVLVAAFGGLSLWYHKNAAIQSKVTEFIAEAEERYKKLTTAGGIKFEWVVHRVYQLIPAMIRPLIPRSVIDSMIQKAFDSMQNFAMQQLDHLSEQITKDED